MAEPVGAQLPEDLFAALRGGAGEGQRGTAIVLATVDAEGWAHPALLSYSEVTARDPKTVRLVTYGGSRTTANMRENSKATLIFVEPRMVYYVKGTAREVKPTQTDDSPYVTTELEVHQVLADSTGAQEAAAVITSGITFSRAAGPDAGSVQ